SAGARRLHSCPTRRSSDLREASRELAKGARETLLAVVLPHGNINNLGTLLRLVLLESVLGEMPLQLAGHDAYRTKQKAFEQSVRSEEHTSELQSRENLVCR